jgi:putative phosphoesterase
MKVAIISDLHANFEAVKALQGDLERADMVVCLGDLLGYYCQVNETMDWVRAHVTHCVLGNHDHYVLHGCPESLPPAVHFGAAFAARVLDRAHADWLRQLPLAWKGRVGGRSCLLVHGSPADPLGGYLYPDSPALADLERLDFDVIAFGQTHRFVERRHGNRLHLNPGAVGQSRDHETLGRACAVMLDTDTLAVDRLIRPFAAQTVVQLARASGAGHWIEKHLLA